MKLLLTLCLTLLSPMVCHAGQAEADAAVASVMFDQGTENASYSVRRDGFVDILFGAAVSEREYIRLVELLKRQPDIKGVLAGRGKSNFCPIK